MKTQRIIPAIIPESFDRLEARLREVRTLAERVQIDVMNGTYAPTTSWPYSTIDREVFESIRREDEGLPYWQDFDFEIDLMVKDPETQLEAWALAGAATIIVHVESTEKLDEALAFCAERRIEVALALKPSTDPSVLAPYVSQLTFVQCMGNDRIGYHNVTLDPKVYDQIKTIHERWPELVIGVDIGVTEKTLPHLVHAGATRFASGSSVFEHGGPAQTLRHLESVVESALDHQ